MNGVKLEILDSITYLGIVFKYNGNFSDARTKLVEQAQKSLFSIYRKTRNQHVPLDIQLQLFDSLVEPILLYGSEIWGFENLQLIEKSTPAVLQKDTSSETTDPKLHGLCRTCMVGTLIISE